MKTAEATAWCSALVFDPKDMALACWDVRFCWGLGGFSCPHGHVHFPSSPMRPSDMRSRLAGDERRCAARTQNRIRFWVAQNTKDLHVLDELWHRPAVPTRMQAAERVPGSHAVARGGGRILTANFVAFPTFHRRRRGACVSTTTPAPLPATMNSVCDVDPEEEAVSLLTLSSDSLHIVCLHAAAADVSSLAALGSVCKLLALATAEEDLWQCAAHTSGTALYHDSWRASVGCVRLAEATLRPFVVPVPKSKEVAPRRLRCAHAHASCTLPLQPIEGLVPLTHMEREWLAWFRRYEFGSLHVEDVLVGRVRLQVVHFHDSAEQCVACAVQTADGKGLGMPVRMSDCTQWIHSACASHAHCMRTACAPHARAACACAGRRRRGCRGLARRPAAVAACRARVSSTRAAGAAAARARYGARRVGYVCFVRGWVNARAAGCGGAGRATCRRGQAGGGRRGVVAVV